ncbi:hypothetical protein FB45DRAFT_950840 [Roridomyces roridus]|uniref:AAA+ ATPase domain-containing protein n=1 Tax=Roridomyces roridus TaxID=1738132 RepID=A0AAD7F9C3_9AGAR|nr:hypothetical protein FB45DRAFT_950840 [Roridomyces roridus]
MHALVGPMAVGINNQSSRTAYTHHLSSPAQVSMNIFDILLRLIKHLASRSLHTGTHFLGFGLSGLRAVGSNPTVKDLFRLITLGTIVEVGRMVGEKGLEFWQESEFQMDDFAYDWVTAYLENQNLWNESKTFNVLARNSAVYKPCGRLLPMPNSGKMTNHPAPSYEAAPTQSPSLLRWRGYWMTIRKRSPRYSDAENARKGTLMITLWSRNTRILDDFVSTAREFYYANSQLVPRKQFDVRSEPSESLLNATFFHGDTAYHWVLEYLISIDAFNSTMNLAVTSWQSDLGWPPARAADLHSSDRKVLSDFVAHVKERYSGRDKVSVHLANGNGVWGRTISKSRRALSTLLLPGSTKETILNDAKDFLAGKEWYSRAGIPHRRGYLLYGAPGTGKSSTVHAIAGELELEIYVIPLANAGMNDYTLGELISHTPSRCILLLEDIDCAFPSRVDHQHAQNHHSEPRSAVTLSGLLNVLDSISSGEGRITFATTNHIDHLDPALIRPGRMDVKVRIKLHAVPRMKARFQIEFRLASTVQIEGVFKVFFRPLDAENPKSIDESGTKTSSLPDTEEEVARYAADFAASVPTDTYSIAQIQGYLFTKKGDPKAAVEGVVEWVVAQTQDTLSKSSVSGSEFDSEEDDDDHPSPPPGYARPLQVEPECGQADTQLVQAASDGGADLGRGKQGEFESVDGVDDSAVSETADT